MRDAQFAMEVAAARMMIYFMAWNNIQKVLYSWIIWHSHPPCANPYKVSDYPARHVQHRISKPGDFFPSENCIWHHSKQKLVSVYPKQASEADRHSSYEYCRS